MKIKLAVLILALSLSSCAMKREKCLNDNSAGFFKGLWHGCIAPISFIGSIFSDDIAVWDDNNNGNWYVFGFLLGVGGLGVGSSSSKKR